MAVLGQAWVTLGTRDADLRRGISSAEGMVKSFAVRAGAAFAGIFAAGAVKSMVSDVLETGKTLQGLDNAFKAITGSSGGAAAEMEFLRKETDRLGQNTLSAAQGLKTIEAAAMGTTMAGKQARDIFSAVSQAAAVLGLRSDETQGALLAIGQMMSKGKVQAEELRGQLGERLPGAFQIAARAMNVTTAELDDMLKKGEVVASDFLPRFASALQEQFAGQAIPEAVAATNRWDNAIMDLKASLASSLLPAFTEVVKGATEVVKAFTDAEKKARDLRAVVNDLATLGQIQIDVDFRYTGMTPDQMLEQWGVGKGDAVSRFFGAGEGLVRRALKDPTGRSGMLLGPDTSQPGLFRDVEQYNMALRKLNPELKRMDQAQSDASRSSAAVSAAIKDARKAMESAEPPTRKLKEQIANLDMAYRFGGVSAEEYKTAHADLEVKLAKAEKRAGGSAKAAKGMSEAQREAQRIINDSLSPMEKYAEELEKIKYWYDYGAISSDAYAKATAKLKAEFGDAARSLSEIYELRKAIQMLDQDKAFRGSPVGGDVGIMMGGILNEQASRRGGAAGERFNPEEQANQYAVQAQRQQDYLASVERMYAEIDRLRQNDVISEQAAMEAKAQILQQQQEAQYGGTIAMLNQVAALQTSKTRELAMIGKAAAVAQATITGVLAVQRALAGPPGPPWSFAIAGVTAAMTAMNVAQIIATPAYAKGGRPPVGRDILVGERGPELLRLDRPGTIIPNNQLNGGSTRAGANGGWNIVIENHGAVVEVPAISEGEIRIIARREAEQTVRKEAPSVIAAEFENPNSRVSKGMERNTNAGRRR